MPRAAQRLLRKARTADLKVALPACGQCGEERFLEQTSPTGERLGGRCTKRRYAAPCSICDRLLPITRRIGESQFCANCWRRDPRSRRECAECGRLRTTHSIVGDKPYCNDCVPKPRIVCFICHEVRRLYSARIGTGVCESCYISTAGFMKPCPECGDKRVIAHDKDDRLVCADCAGNAPLFTCNECGGERGARRTLCSGCDLVKQVEELFSEASDSDARAALEPLRHYLLSYKHDADRLLRWMSRSTSIAILRRILDGEIPISQRALEMPEHPHAALRVRALLEVTGCLTEERDPWASYEQWADQLIAICPKANREQFTIFTRWIVPATARVQIRRRGITDSTLSRAREMSRAALEFLQMLEARNLSLQSAPQSIFDEFAASRRSRAIAIRPFIRWAKQTGAMRRISAPVRPKSAPSLAYSEATHHSWVSRFLEDDQLNEGTRLVGLMVGLYAAPITRLVKLQDKNIVYRGETATLSLGNAPLHLAPRVTELLGMQLAQRAISPEGWLFPSPALPGRHIDPSTLTKRLRDLGCETILLRGAAMINLTATVPLGPLADLTGRSLSATGRWIKSSGSTYLVYPAIRDPSRPGVSSQ